MYAYIMSKTDKEHKKQDITTGAMSCGKPYYVYRCEGKLNDLEDAVGCLWPTRRFAHPLVYCAFFYRLILCIFTVLRTYSIYLSCATLSPLITRNGTSSCTGGLRR